MSRQPDGLQDNGDGEDPSSGHTCCSNTGCRGSHSRGWDSRISHEPGASRGHRDMQNMAAMAWN